MDPTFYASYYRHESSHWWFRWRFDLITDLVASLRHEPPYRILDAGCGTGQMLKHIEPLGQTFGIDTAPQAIGYARSRGVQRLVRGSITAVPFADGTFDCVLALDVIEHVDDDIGILNRLFDVVKPGGHLIVTVPAFKALWSEHDEINLHKRRYRLPELRRLIEEAGFDLQRATYCNTALYLPVLMIRKAKNLLRALTRQRRSDDAPPQSDLGGFPRPVNEALYWLMKGEMQLMRHVDLPFGVSILAVAVRPVAASSRPHRPARTSMPAGRSNAPVATTEPKPNGRHDRVGGDTPAPVAAAERYAEAGDPSAH